MDCTDLYPVNPVISRLKVQLGLEEDRVEQWLQDCIQARLALTEQSTSSTGTAATSTKQTPSPTPIPTTAVASDLPDGSDQKLGPPQVDTESRYGGGQDWAGLEQRLQSRLMEQLQARLEKQLQDKLEREVETLKISLQGQLQRCVQ